MNSLFNVVAGTEYRPNSVVAVPAATTTLTLTQAAHANRTISIASTGGLAITPPAATGTFDTYTFLFVATVTGGSVTIDAKAGNASDVFKGWIQTYKATTFTPYIANSTFNLITLDGDTQGGFTGDVITMRDAGTHLWIVTGFCTQADTIATMFSTH